jgi:hypothetical protein
VAELASLSLEAGGGGAGFAITRAGDQANRATLPLVAGGTLSRPRRGLAQGSRVGRGRESMAPLRTRGADHEVGNAREGVWPKVDVPRSQKEVALRPDTHTTARRSPPCPPSKPSMTRSPAWEKSPGAGEEAGPRQGLRGRHSFSLGNCWARAIRIPSFLRPIFGENVRRMWYKSQLRPRESGAAGNLSQPQANTRAGSS